MENHILAQFKRIIHEQRLKLEMFEKQQFNKTSNDISSIPVTEKEVEKVDYEKTMAEYLKKLES